MRWFVTSLKNVIYLFRGFLLVLRVLGFFNPFLYRHASCWDGTFPQVPRGKSRVARAASKWQLPVVDISAALAPLFSSSVFLSLPLPPFFPCEAVGSHNAWHSPWFVFQVLLFPPCEAQSFQRLRQFRVFLSERQKPLWRSCPDLWESVAKQ